MRLMLCQVGRWRFIDLATLQMALLSRRINQILAYSVGMTHVLDQRTQSSEALKR
jgi:hypothetical protein